MGIKEVKSRLKQKVGDTALFRRLKTSILPIFYDHQNSITYWHCSWKTLALSPYPNPNYLNAPPTQPRRTASLPVPLQCQSLCPSQSSPPCVHPVQEQAENGFPTAGSMVIDNNSTAEFPSSTGAVRREGPSHTWDDRRPITMHLGQVGRNEWDWGVMRMKIYFRKYKHPLY